MPYSDIPGVKAAFLDGAFKITNRSSQPNILVIGPASEGRTNARFNVAAVGEAEKEFGASSPVLRVVHELLEQNADNISIMRSGGRQGSFVFEDGNTETLTITPEYRDDNILARYALVIENDGVDNRYLVYDLEDQTWVYDTSEILVINSGLVKVEDTGIDLFTLGSTSTPDLLPSLSATVVGDFTADGTAAASSITLNAGADGLTDSLVERYAALNSSYHLLDFKDADYVIPVDVYIDDENIADDAAVSTYGYYWAGVPAKDSALDKLGYVWQYIYRGKLYTYFTDTADYFDTLDGADAATITVNTDLVLSSLKDGIGGNANTITIDDSGSAGPTVNIVENSDGGLDITVVDDGTSTTSDTVTAINAALGLFNLANGVVADTLLQASGGGVTTLTATTKTNLTGGKGGHVLTHQDLTGDAVPAAVTAKFAAGADAELRECNFAHQLASFLYLASTNWKAMMGGISFKAPPAVDRSSVADWVGQLPEYTDTGVYKYIDAPADNGAGILGNKFISGFSKTSDGYRSHLVEDGDATDSYHFGGLILTKGAALPNGSQWPYGINDGDEALDSGGAPIDIGKHIFVTYSWPVLSNGFNGGSSYRGDIVATFLGTLIRLPPNEEPIGQNGRARSVQDELRIHHSQLNALSRARVIGLRREDGFGLVFTTAKTAAHPVDSDYSRSSTTRAANTLLEGIRRIAKPYVGKEFSSQRLISLQNSIDTYLLQQRSSKVHQGAKARIEYSRADRVLGRMKVKLRFVPPFSIESITVETSLAADESEL